MSRLGILLCGITVVACGKTTPPAPPVVSPPAANETINGTERLGWDQRAADAVELALIRYAVYVDGTRSELVGVSCASSATTAGFACSAQLPALSAGSHTLELASFIADGSVLESARSAPLGVTVVPATTTSGLGVASSRREPAWTAGAGGMTSDRVALHVELLTAGLDRPSDIAFAPDGHLLVAERSGRIRIVRDGHLLRAAAWSLADTEAGPGQVLALALDPGFDRNGFVFAIYTAPSRSGELTFNLARLREASDTLVDRIVLLDRVRAVPGDAAASLRFGPDGKLYAAFDDGGDLRSAGDFASPNGKVLRLNADGTTPRDQAGATPLYSYAYRSPRGLDWDPVSGSLWVADRDTADSARLSRVVRATGARPDETRGVVRESFVLPRSTVPSSLAFYRGHLFPAFVGNLLVASDEGRHLLRISVGHGFAVERLLQDRVGGVRVVTVGPDGAIYFATRDTIGRLTPQAN